MKRILARMATLAATLAIGFTVHAATAYHGLFVGVNEFSHANYLYGCDWDTIRLMDAYTRGGFCPAANAEMVANLAATKETVRAKFQALAGKAQSGDTVLYYQSSHGGDYDDNKGSFLCLTDDEWYDTEFADDLAMFADGVRVIVVLDACYSGGMFKAANGEASGGKKAMWNFAARVQSKLNARRAAAKAAGTKGVPEVAWITAADWNEVSYMDGRGSEFTHALLAGWENGSADTDSDGYVSFGELAEYAKGNVSGSSVQSDNDTLLNAVLAGQDFDVNTFRLLSANNVVYGFLGECPASLVIPDATVALADGAFCANDGYVWNLTSVTLPSGLTKIGFQAFMGCDGLTEVTIPASVTTIEECAFMDCASLATVTFEGNVDDIDFMGGLGSAFAATPWLTSIYPPPANDSFENAIEIPGSMSGSVVGTNINATVVSDEPLYVNLDAGSTVWWKWTASEDGEVQFNTFGSNFDTVMGVYTGSAVDALDIVDENDDWSHASTSQSHVYQSQVTFFATAGTTYYIAVGGYDVAAGEIVLEWGPDEVELEWYVSRDSAVDAAQALGRRILLVSGRDTCPNTTYLRETACYDPDVLEILTEDFVLWYNNCDTDGSDVWAYTDGLGTYDLPLVCVLDPYDMDTYVARSTGFMDEYDLYDFLMDLPEASSFRLLIEDGWINGYSGEIPEGESVDLEIPDSVEGIGDNAFEGLEGLRSLYIPASVTYIGDYAFADCPDLEEVYVEDRDGDDLLYIGESAFDGCEALTDLSLGEGVGEIGAYAFYGTGIDYLDVPATVTNVGNGAFEDCMALESVCFWADDSMTDSCLEIGEFAFLGCESLSSVLFDDRPYDPENDVWNGIYIGESAFDGCEALTDLYLGEGVEEIYDYAFYGIGIDYLEIPASCCYIGENAFAYSENLEDVYFAGYDAYGDDYSLDMDEDSVFEETPYGKRFRLDVDDNVIVGWKGEIPEGEMVDLEIPDGIEGIGDNAFEDIEGLRYLYVPASVTYIGDYAFVGCSDLEEVYIEDRDGDDLLYIGESAFDGCEALTDLYLGEGVEEISDYAFYDIGIEYLEVPSTVTRIGENAFAYSENLEEVYFYGYDVYGADYELTVDISSAFEETPWLTTAPENDNFAAATALSGSSGIVMGRNISATLESGEVHRCSPSATVWYKWTPATDETVLFDVMADYDSILGVYTGTSVGSLAPVAFNDDIDEYSSAVAFDAVAGKTYYIAVGGYHDKEGAFVLGWEPYEYEIRYQIDANGVLTGFESGLFLPPTLTIPEGVTAIADSVFEEQEGVVAVNLPSTLTSIGDYAFAWCDDLATVNGLTDSVEIGAFAFKGTPFDETRPFGLEIVNNCVEGFHGRPFPATLTIPEGVTNIDESAFCYLDYGEWVYDEATDEEYEVPGTNPLANLRAVEIPASVVSIGPWAFEDCTNLATVAIGNYAILIDGSAFSGCTSLDIDVERAGYKLVGWDLLGYDGATSAVARVDGVARIDDIAPLIYGLPTGVRHAETVWDEATQSYVQRGVANTNALEGVWATPAWKRLTLWSPTMAGGGHGGISGGQAGADKFAGEAAATYDGYVYDENGLVKGVVQLKASKAKLDRKTGKKMTAVVVSVQMMGERKLTARGNLDLETATFVADVGGRTLTLNVGANGISGKYGPYLVDGARNRFVSREADDIAAGEAALGRWQDVYTVACEDAEGWSGFSLSVAAKGKVKVQGTLANGTKVSVNSQLLVGEDGVCLIPVVISRKAEIAFNVWLTDDGVDVAGMDDEEVVAGRLGALAVGARFDMEVESLTSLLGDGTYADYLPVGLSVALKEGKWVVADGAKAGKVQLKRGAVSPADVDNEKLGLNPSALKLNCAAKTGLFKGSFKAYTVGGGKPKATMVTVMGVLVNGTGYGAATIRNVGSVPVTIGVSE